MISMTLLDRIVHRGEHHAEVPTIEQVPPTVAVEEPSGEEPSAEEPFVEEAPSPAEAGPFQSPEATAVAPEPVAAEAPAGGRTRMDRITTLLIVGGLATVVWMFIWAIFATVGTETPTPWETVPGWANTPAGNVAVVPPTPKLPHKAAGSLTSLSKLPPMVLAGVHANVTMRVDPPPLGGTYGTDGQVQDNFSPAFFSVPAGKTVHVVVYNYDDAAHSFTAPALGVNVQVPAGGSKPSVTRFSFTASGPGNFFWVCAIPCDNYSMNTPGYMTGEIHVVAS